MDISVNRMMKIFSFCELQNKVTDSEFKRYIYTTAKVLNLFFYVHLYSMVMYVSNLY